MIVSTIESIPRGGYIALGVVFFIMSSVLSFRIFNSEISKDVSLPSVAQKDNVINSVPQQSQSSINQSQLTSIPSNISTPEVPETAETPETPETSNIDKDNQKKANITAINQKIDSIDGAIKKTNGEINYAKSQIDYQHSQIKMYQKNHDKDIQNAEKYDDAIAYREAQEMNKNIQDANKRINHLQGVILADQKKITDLKSQKQLLIQEKE